MKADIMRTLTMRQLRQNLARTGLTLLEITAASGLLSAVLMGGLSFARAVNARLDEGLALLVLQAAGLLAVLLLLTAAFLIYSAFAVSLRRRLQALSLLAAVGATRRQLAASVWWEAALLGGVGIPAGIAFAALGLAVTFSLLGRVEAVTGLVGPLRLEMSVPGLLLCAGWTALCLVLAAFRPARAAFRLQPVQGLSDGKNAVRGRRVHPLRTIRPGRGLERQLAHRSLLQDKARQRALRTGMGVSLALLMAAAGFSQGVSNAYAHSEMPFDCRWYVWGTAGSFPDEALRQAVALFPGIPSLRVESVDHFRFSEEYGEIAEKLYVLEDDDFAAWYGAPLPQAEEPGSIPYILSTRDSIGAGADGAPLQSETPVYNAVPRQQVGICDTPLPLHAGERTPSLQHASVYRAQVTSRSAYEAAFANGFPAVDRAFSVYYGTDDGRPLERRLYEFDAHSLFQDYTPHSEYALRRAGVTMLCNVFLGGFVAAVFLTVAVSTVGTAGADLAMRRRELALLQSAGITRRQLKKMLRHQCFAGLMGLPAGFVLGLPPCAVFARLLNVPFWETFSAAAAIAGAAALCGISFAALRFARRQLAGSSVAEDLAIFQN